MHFYIVSSVPHKNNLTTTDQMDGYIRRMEVKSNDVKLCSRVRFALKDVIDLHKVSSISLS